MEQQNEPSLSGVLIAELKEFNQAIETLSTIQSNLKWPQTDMVEKAKAALANRFLDEKFNLKPSQVQPGEKQNF